MSKQASSQKLRLSSRTVTNRPNQANGNVNSYVSPPQPAQICLNYNRNVRARCEFPGNICKFQRIHKCLVYFKYGCKSINHKSMLPDNINQNAQGYVATLSGQESNFDSVNVKQRLTQRTQIKPLIKSCMRYNRCQSHSAWKTLSTLLHPPPPPPSDSQLKCPVFGCPSITALPNDLEILNLDFSSRHILWTPVVSVGVSLPLPLDSCCSVSLVSQSHADVICQKSPQLTYQRLEQPIPVAVATSATQLKALLYYRFQVPGRMGKAQFFQC